MFHQNKVENTKMSEETPPFDPERLALLMHAVRNLPPVERQCHHEPFNAEPTIGQLWRAWCGPESDEETDPSPAVLLINTSGMGPDHFQAIPVFADVEMTGQYDILLPEEVFGCAWALAVSESFTVDICNLHSCLGRLPEAWIERTRFAMKNERCLDKEEALVWGQPYASKKDQRIKWRDEFLQNMQPMQSAALSRMNL